MEEPPVKQGIYWGRLTAFIFAIVVGVPSLLVAMGWSVNHFPIASRTVLILVFVATMIFVATREQKVLLRVKRKLSGQCVHCGYDLRASPERCPECGTDVSREKAGHD